MLKKVVKNGRVAVLVSPGFGAGWYTWNRHVPQCLFDPDVVAWVEADKPGTVPLQFVPDGDYFYEGGAEDLIVEWVPENTKFRVVEYDGSERIEVLQDMDFMTA